MKSFLLSALVRRYHGKGFEAFKAELANDWLVWEPGSWKPPRSRTVTFAAPVPDPVAAAAAAAREEAHVGEALALVLDLAAVTVTLGREGCDLVINDGTLSARHLQLSPTPAGWVVEDLGSRNGTRVDGVRLAEGTRMPIRSGAKIAAAQCLFTFLTPEALWARLRA